MKSQTVPKKIVDKNGRATTVHVNPNKKTNSKKTVLPIAVSSNTPFVTSNEGLVEVTDLLAQPDSSWRVHDFIYRRNLVHNHILANYRFGKDDTDAFEALRPYMTLRDTLEKPEAYIDMDALPTDDGLDFMASDVVVESVFVDGQERQGFSNELSHPDDARDAIREASSELSRVWLAGLSSADASAAYGYSSSSDDYAAQHGNSSLPERWRDFEDAVARSPKVTPFVTYTGVNAHYVDDILAQVGSGEVVLDRVFSSSLNPAQVNGFATAWDTLDPDRGEGATLVLEVETDRGAFMDVIARLPDEMEVMLPKGRYEVIEVLDSIEYLWGDHGDHTNGKERVGRVIDKTVRLRFLGE
jgi:hypothetical protein